MLVHTMFFADVKFLFKIRCLSIFVNEVAVLVVTDFVNHNIYWAPATCVEETQVK